MGMYDNISNGLAERILQDCPLCHKNMYVPDYDEVEWQTKDFKNLLETLSIADILCDVFEMHTICPKCNNYISVNVDLIEGHYIVNGTQYKLVLDVYDKSLAEDHKKIMEESSIPQASMLDAISYVELLNYVDTLKTDYCDEIIDYIFDNFYLIPKHGKNT